MARKTYSEQEKEMVRVSLLNTVIQCIVDRGLIHSSIEILCNKVGISKTFFYTLFPSKEELVLEALRYQQPKLLQYAKQLIDDDTLSWREGVRTFLDNCVHSEKRGIAVLSIEEEQEVFRCLSEENIKIFRENQQRLFQEILNVFGIPENSIEPRLFCNLSLSMMMVYKAIPNTMPFLFPEIAEEMVEFQINTILDLMQSAKGCSNRL